MIALAVAVRVLWYAVLGVPTLAFLCCLTVAIYRITLHPLASIPGPKLAAVSNIWYARHITQGRMAKLGPELHKIYGDTVRIGPNEVWFNSKEAFDQIYCTGRGFEKSDFYLATTLSRIHVDWQLRVHFPDTLDLLSERHMQRYRLQRRLIGRVYGAANVLKFETAIDDTVKLVVQKLSLLEGRELDLKEWMHIITVECLGATVLSWSPGMIRDGADWGTLAHSYQGWRRKSLFGAFPTMKKLEQWSPRIGRLFASLWGVTYKTPQDFKSFFPAVSRIVTRRIRSPSKPKQNKGLRGDLLSDLTELHEEKPEFTKTYLRKMAVTNFGAGHETMASTLTAAVAMIASHDKVQCRIAKELRAEDRLLSYAAHSGYNYVRAAIRETMRLHPVVAMSLPRKTPATGMKVHGVRLPAGTTVGCSPMALHRNEDIAGAEPDKFDPDRWLCAESDKTGRLRIMEKYNLNWGGGSRSCPGRNLAELIVYKVVASLFHAFDVEVSIPHDADKEAYFLFMLSGVKARFSFPAGSALEEKAMTNDAEAK